MSSVISLVRCYPKEMIIGGDKINELYGIPTILEVKEEKLWKM